MYRVQVLGVGNEQGACEDKKKAGLDKFALFLGGMLARLLQKKIK